jgi:RIO-like serine/threonine protein kinase
LYKITSIISKHKSILLVQLNPLLVDSRQSAILEEELRSVLNPEFGTVEIDDALHHILQFVLENNQRYSVVSFKKISRAFSIDKATTAKRVKFLEDNGLIVVKKMGREKTVRLSEDGVDLFRRIHSA